MFERNKHSDPQKVFKSCQLKQIETVNDQYYINAILHCPRTEDEKVNVESGNYSGPNSRHWTPTDALDTLSEYAANILCNSCPLVSMTAVEATIQRAEKAQADAQLLRAQAALIEARQELDIINRRVLGE